jgi:hypothetical protein
VVSVVGGLEVLGIDDEFGEAGPEDDWIEGVGDGVGVGSIVSCLKTREKIMGAHL